MLLRAGSPPAHRSDNREPLPLIGELFQQAGRDTRQRCIAVGKALEIGVTIAHMRLQPGARLGVVYEIISALGAGGMGEVYRARDSRLERDVAIKVLPERLAAMLFNLLRNQLPLPTAAHNALDWKPWRPVPVRSLHPFAKIYAFALCVLDLDKSRRLRTGRPIEHDINVGLAFAVRAILCCHSCPRS